MKKYTLHTHTVGFDGQDSVRAMVESARDKGFKVIGISNHFIVNPLIKKTKMYPYALNGGYANIYSASFDEALERFVMHYEDLKHVQQEYPDMQILRGMEVDFFQDAKWEKGFYRAVQILRPDYLIGSAHLIKHDGTLLNTHDWKNADCETQNELLKKYWMNVANAAESGMFHWMAHLDLPKKVGLGREEKWAEFESRAVESAAKTKTAIEINTSYYRDFCYEPYPSNRILEMIKHEKVPVIICDDAHEVKNIGRHFDEARQLIKTFNLKTYQL